MTNGVTLKDAIEQMFADLRRDNPHLDDVTITHISDMRMDGKWMVWDVYLSNGESFKFEANPPRH